MTLGASAALKALVVVVATLVSTADAQAERPYNVLFVAIDDLQPVLGAYGSQVADTPNMDALLDRGIRFENFQSSKSECAPSRISMITGKRNDAIKAWGFEGTFRKENPKLHTMPGWLRTKAGYKTVGVGKILDNRSFDSTDEDDSTAINYPDLCASADDKFCSWDDYVPPKLMRDESSSPCSKYVLRWPSDPVDAAKEADKNYALEYSFESSVQDRHLDYCVREIGVQKLKELAADPDTPWFLGVGFVQPHMPWVARQEDFDTYRTVPDSMLNPDPLVQDSTTWWTDKQYSARSNQELGKYGNQENLDDSDLVRGYYAGTRFVDEQIGELMSVFDNEIDEAVRNNTMIIFWGDHGFHLGDRGLYGKKTVYEHATRVPAGIVPAKNWLALDSARSNGVGSFTSCPLDTVDFYPTVLDMIGLEVSTQVGSTDPVVLGGTSLSGLFKDTNACPRAAAISQYENQLSSNNQMGYSIRSKCYRLIVYMPLKKTASSPLPNKKNMNSAELYRYAEPGVWEYDDDVDSTDADMVNAESELTKLVSSLSDSDWTHLIGEMPFDMNDC